MLKIRTLLAGGAAAATLAVGLCATVAVPAHAATPVMILDGARTDNYKACFNANEAADSRSFLSLTSVTVGGVVFHHNMVLPAGSDAGFKAAGDGISLKGADGSSAVLTAATTSTNISEHWVRFDRDGHFGAMLGMKDRSALKSSSITETLTVRRTSGGTVLGTASADYRYDTVAATAPHSTDCWSNPYSREYNGPAGRWYVAGTATYFDWDTNHQYPPKPTSPPPPDTTAPTLQSVTMPATTTTRTITIGVAASDNVKVTEVRFANEDGNWSAWQPFATSKQWALSSSAAPSKGVTTQVRDAAHNESNTIYKRITCNAPCN